MGPQIKRPAAGVFPLAGADFRRTLSGCHVFSKPYAKLQTTVNIFNILKLFIFIFIASEFDKRYINIKLTLIYLTLLTINISC